ncbi:aromatic ring-hydroxylating dioxygenase subunit alpha [Parendozoicomonas sp. Alg238-R29]|uniref:aromatic ring-hydroxylating oxygenase subunit alpha n=1 Tax=Parendozoicomonas sp. Alg238-R29 TaxID=2993446 RepID=UPI00248EE4D6|nr:aromatic ring-hydroxylating dioxygenase subunit alpha [Parendozoicomonas sp. Alg238-R29]
MQLEEQHRLIDRVLQLETDKTTDMAEHCSAIDVALYRDEKQFHSEEENLFRQLPMIVGHVSQLPAPGDFITHDICGVPVVVLRRQTGELKAFMNVCKHRGGRLVRDEKGSDLRVLVCHYHAWTYDTDGSLRGVPHKDGFRGMPDGCNNLTELPVSDHLGFLWVRLAPFRRYETATQFNRSVEEFLGEQFNADFSSYGTSSHTVFDPVDFHRPINWKLAIDTFLENYHVRKTHRNTIDAMFLDTVGIYERFGCQQRNLYPKKSIVSLRDKPRSEWQLCEHGNMLYTFFPNTLILIEPDHINVSIVFPDGIEHTKLINFTLLPEEPTEKGIKYFRKNNDILYAALEEDFSMAIDIQKGLRSGANQQFLHGRFEQGLKYFHESVEGFCE